MADFGKQFAIAACEHRKSASCMKQKPGGASVVMTRGHRDFFFFQRYDTGSIGSIFTN